MHGRVRPRARSRKTQFWAILSFGVILSAEFATRGDILAQSEQEVINLSAEVPTATPTPTPTPLPTSTPTPTPIPTNTTIPTSTPTPSPTSIPTQGTVIISGLAYPNSAVAVLKDGTVVTTVLAGADARFSVTLTGLSSGNYIFSFYSEDNQGRRSSLYSFVISTTAGAITEVSGVFISPTIDTDKAQVKHGETITVLGQSLPNAEITIEVHSEQDRFFKTETDASGAYAYTFDTSSFDQTEHSTRSRAAYGGQVSNLSNSISFVVGTINVPREPECAVADLNCDGRVNLVDFSIAAFWYQRTISKPISKFDIPQQDHN